MVERDADVNDKLRIQELELRERLERAFRSRFRWTLGVFALILSAVAFFAYVSARRTIEAATLEAAREEVQREVAQAVQAMTPDIPSLRQELRDDALYARNILLEGHADLQAEIRNATASAERIETASETLDEETRQLRVLRGSVTLLERTLASEIDRVKKLHEAYEADRRDFTLTTKNTATNAAAVIDAELQALRTRVEQELDEVRLVLADHAAGTPALFSSWLDLGQGRARLEGTNFGTEPGRVLIRVRVFGPGLSSPLVGESESILVVSKSWSPTTIEIDMGQQLVNMLAEAQAKATKDWNPTNTRVGYGILIQTADGRLSHWSGLNADSTVSGDRGDVRAGS